MILYDSPMILMIQNDSKMILYDSPMIQNDSKMILYDSPKDFWEIFGRLNWNQSLFCT